MQQPGPRPSDVRVLVVEDDPATSTLLRQLLNESGCTVLATASMREAQQLYDDERPQITIVDVYLDDGNGIDVIRHIRSRRAACRIIAVTADHSDLLRSQATRAGADAHLTKPVRVGDLRRALGGR